MFSGTAEISFIGVENVCYHVKPAWSMFLIGIPANAAIFCPERKI
jgi:hypothetical protein